MQLVGATKWFIQKPFIIKYLKISLVSSIFSIFLLYLIFQKIQENFPELNLLQEKLPIIIILIFVFIFGSIINLTSTIFVTKRFLDLKSDEIY
jgi:cell division transport system permease protein